MKKMIAVACCTAFLLACVPEGSSGSGSGGSGSDAGAASADAGPADTGPAAPADAGPATPVDAGPPGEGACTNEADMAARDIINASDNDMGEISKTCGLGCFQSEGANFSEDCVNNCIREAVESAVSDACIGCYTGSVMCTKDNCLFQCATNPDAPGCVSCQCGGNRTQTNCYEVYARCSGIPSTVDCN